MDFFVWIMAGAVLGWIGCTRLGINEGRGLVVSVIIGAVGGVIGGHVLAPMFAAAASPPGGFSVAALLAALGASTALLFASNLVYDRWGI